MGGSPKAPDPQPVPAMPAPIDYDKMYAAASKAAIEQMREQEAQLERLYPKMVGLQLGTARQVASELDNQYLGRARDVIGQELDAASTPNEIEARLQADALRELQLGRSLTPEQEREATQSARSALAARGLGTGNAATAAEILNRSAYADAREANRRQFALGANQLDLARRQRRLGLAGDYAGLDPYRSALGPAFGLGTATMGQGTNMIGQTFGNAVQTAGNVESFNRNMAASDRFSARNYNAAIQGAYMQSNAANNAGWMSMLGGGMQGLGSIGAARMG